MMRAPGAAACGRPKRMLARGTRAAMVSLKTAVRTRRLKSVAIRVAALCVLLLVLGFAGFVRSLPSQPVPLTRNADGIVVLTGGTPYHRQRLELLAAHRGNRLLITGVNPGTTTADIAHQIPHYDGHVCIRCVDLDYSATSTHSAMRCKTRFWAADHGFGSLIVVTFDLSYATRVGRTRTSIAQHATLMPHPCSIRSSCACTNRGWSNPGYDAAGIAGISQISRLQMCECSFELRCR